jgi:hypothetical protein
MQSGTIDKNGVQNIKAMAELIEEQKVVYQFEYASQDFPLSASVLILSDTRSMFKNSMHVPGLVKEGSEYEMTDEKLEEILNDQDLI